MRTGVITQKVGMTRLFLAGRDRMCRSRCSSWTAAPSSAPAPRRRTAMTAVQLGSGFAKAEEHQQGRTRPVRQGRSRTAQEGRGIPHRREEHAGSRRHAAGRSFRRRPEGGRHRRHHRPRLHRRDEALEFPRPGSVARRVDQPSLAGRHRRPPGSRQDLQEQEDARPLRRRQHHHPESGSRQGRCRARPHHGPRRGARLQGRLGDGARRRQAPAQGCADARLGQEARSEPRRLPAAEQKAEG